MNSDEVYYIFHGSGTPGIAGLIAIRDAALELQPLFQKIGCSIDTMTNSLGDGWQGIAADMATQALKPLRDSSTTIPESLGQLAKAAADEIDAYLRAASNVTPNTRFLLQTANAIIEASSGAAATSLLGQMQQRMEIMEHNIQVYHQFVAASSQNTASVPTTLNISWLDPIGFLLPSIEQLILATVPEHAGTGVTHTGNGFMFTPAVVQTQLNQVDGILQDLQTAGTKMEPIRQGASATNDPAGRAISTAISKAGQTFIAGVNAQQTMVNDWAGKVSQAKQQYMTAEGLTETQWNRLAQGLSAETTPAPRRAQVVTTRPAAHVAVPPRPVTRPPAPAQPPLPARPQAGDGFVPPPPVTTPMSVTIQSAAPPLTPTPTDNGPILTEFVPPEDLAPVVTGVLFSAPVPLGGGVPGPLVGGASQTLQPTSGTGQVPGAAVRQPETVGAPGTGVPAEGEEPAPGTAAPGQANSEEQALMAEEESGGARSTAVPPMTGGRGNTGTGDPEHRRRYGLPMDGEKRFGTTERTIPPVIGETVAQRARREAESDARPN